jgi:hypothetical protein
MRISEKPKTCLPSIFEQIPHDLFSLPPGNDEKESYLASYDENNLSQVREKRHNIRDDSSPFAMFLRVSTPLQGTKCLQDPFRGMAVILPVCSLEGKETP